MRPIIWKELRENFKWAALALLALLLGEAYALTSRRDSADIYSGITLCSTTFLMVSAFGCSLIGAMLGIVQILPERRRDQWASLLHRPATRGAIFGGKVAAGILLYFFATAFPFLASVTYAALPGQFPAPFVPGMLVPAFSDLFLGIAFYFGALLICLHPGKWYGSRGAIALAMVLIFSLHVSAGWPFLLPLITSAILLLAGWGAMLSNGPAGPRPPATRFAFTLIVLVGACCAVIIFSGLLQWLPWGKPAISADYTDFKIASDGQVFLETQMADGGTILKDMDGKIVTDEKYAGNDREQSFCPLISICWNADLAEKFQEQYFRNHPRVAYNYVRPTERDYDSKETWYLLVAQRYLIGYDKLSHRCVGICDVEGFKPAGARPKSFPKLPQFSSYNFSKPALFWVQPNIYGLDFDARQMTSFFNAGKESIYGISAFPLYRTGERYAAAALSGGIRILDQHGAPLMSLPYRRNIEKWPGISITCTDALEQIYVQYEPSWRVPGAGNASTPIYLDEYDFQGTLVRTYSRTQPALQPQPSWAGRLASWIFPPLPAALIKSYKSLFPSPLPAFYENGISYSGSVSDVVIAWIAGLALGIFTWLWAARVGMSTGRACQWGVFVACFGLPGLITFRLMARWPTRVSCPQCGRQRSIAAEECGSCSASWPAPSASGTEIFDQAAAK